MTTVAWKTIEHNWPVYAADGEQVGKVFLVVGDENEDIFDGLAITHHGGPFVFHNYEDRPHYVPADQVASIDPGRVTLSISAEQRSEEHTSELQSQFHLVCRLLLEKKKKN